MPYRELEGKWRCSWKCGFAHEVPDVVIKHENEAHNAVQKIATKKEE